MLKLTILCTLPKKTVRLLMTFRGSRCAAGDFGDISKLRKLFNERLAGPIDGVIGGHTCTPLPGEIIFSLNVLSVDAN